MCFSAPYPNLANEWPVEDQKLQSAVIFLEFIKEQILVLK